MTQAKIYLIPVPISAHNPASLSVEISRIVPQLRHYFVENIRTARRFIKSIYKEADIDNTHFSEIDKHNGADKNLFKKWITEGKAIGIMSESGCPGIADPGAELVAMAQEMNVEIIPLVGPSSLLLALMASGLNGQQFCFNGYLPVKEPARSKEIKTLEHFSKQNNQTQLFIETPYRNNTLLNDFLKNCNDATKLCIAFNITAPNAFIKTKTIHQWKQENITLEKEPCVFLLLAH